MNTFKYPSSNKEAENVSTRVKNTKKEIELLKADLEKLISSGVGSKSPLKENEVPKPVTQPTEPAHPPSTIKKNVEVPQSKPEPKKDSPKKPRSYNVAEAREYIKKQKEKRAEQLKAQINVTDNKIDLKKQKLKELHQKTLDLVTKNVQLKRERSKSRDKEPPVRPDKSQLKKSAQENIRPKSQERGAATSRQKSQDRVKSSQQRLKSQERVLREKSQENVQKVRPNAQKSPSNVRNKSQEKIAQGGPSRERSKAGANGRASRPRTRQEKPAPPPILSLSGREIDTNLLYPPDLKLQKTDEDVFEKTTLPPFENKISTDTHKIDLNKRITTRLEHSIMTDACLKDTKETQTNQRAEPVWLKPPPTLPYPYNFINTVKRKLQYAINSPVSCVDVGVQNSARGTPEIEAKTKEEIKELLIKSAASDLKSFASHKCPNLDLKAVENLELKKSDEVVSRNLFGNYDSESDTSKNIPDISSESLGSSQKNGGDSEPILSLHRLRNLKLHPHKLTTSKSSGNVKTDSNGYPKWLSNNNNNNNSYSSDFLNESEGHKSRSSGTIKTVSKVGHVSSGSHSSIKTVASEKKQPPQFLIPSSSPIFHSNRSSYGSVTKATENNSIEDPSTFKSLLVEGQTSGSTVESNSDHGSTVFKPTSLSRVDGLALKEPTLSLSYKKVEESSSSVTSSSNSRRGSKSSFTQKKEEKNLDLLKSKMKNITIRPAISTNNDVNEIHLKFEAEVRLLSDFNESFKQFVAVEKAFEHLKSKNDANVAMTKIMQNVDTQTSVVAKSSTNVTTAENSLNDRKNPSINFSRGSEIIEELNDSILSNNRNVSKSLRNSSFSTDFDLSSLNRSNTNVSTEEETRVELSLSNVENYNLKNCAGLSLNMFEQLIKDEDARIQHLKAIIKIREQALLDRTKGELVWLEIQRKQLIETGKVEEASLLKKKQRGIILKHEQERNEIKKLKQMQKEASEERKNILKQQRNLIKSQLSTNKMLSEMKVKTPRERRSTGPLRVVQSRSESVRSETSISRKSSAGEEVLSVTSRSVRVSEVESELDFSKEADGTNVSNAKRALLMREAALQKRRKAAEELLRWHRKLLDEEKKIAELEATANSVIKRMPREAQNYDFSGKQLKNLWKSMTGRDDGKFVEEKVCKCSRQSANKNKKTLPKNSETASEDNYSSVFEPESVQEIINSQEEKTKISSISELIDNFTRIEDEISLLSRKSELDITSLEERIETLPKEEDTASQPSTKSSSQASVLRTMTPNHLSEPEDVQTVRTQEIGESESAATKNEEIVANHVEDRAETNDKQTESKATEERSSSTKTGSTIDQEEITSERIVAETTELSDSTSAIINEKEKTEESAGSSPKTVSSIDRDVISEKIVEESTERSHLTSTAVNEKQSKAIDASSSLTNVDDQEEIASEKIVEEISERSHLTSPATNEKEETERSKATKASPSPKTEPTIDDQEEIASEKIVEESTERSHLSSVIINENQETEQPEAIDASSSVTTASSVKDQEEIVSEKIVEEESSKQSHTASATSEATEASSGNAPESTVQSTETIPSRIEAKESTESSASAVSSQSEAKESTESSRSASEDPSDVSEAPASSKEVSSKEEPSEIPPLALDEALESASKIEESLSKLNERLSVEKKGEASKEVESSDVSKSEERTPPKKTADQIDVKKRVSEILADASGHRGDKSPRVQDLYVTAYDVGAPNLPELTEPFEDGRPLPTDIFGSEAEELWRKQLAIEQEIKQLEQQQKEQLPYVFMREIPNKPPPPYTPPSSVSSLPQSILPSGVKEINEITDYSSKVLYKAYLNNTLEKVKFSENGFKLFSKVEVGKVCAEFVFNICRDIARVHYKQFEKVEQPSWLTSTKKPQLAKTKPPDAAELDKIMNRKLRELFGFKNVQSTESAIIKWGRKKRDHVDEILVVESQEEESQWTNFDSDELFVKDQITNDIMRMLIDETASVFGKILCKKSVVG